MSSGAIYFAWIFISLYNYYNNNYYLYIDLLQAWRLLGGNELGTLAVRKLGSILRGFGKNPTEQEIHFLKYSNGLEGKLRQNTITCIWKPGECYNQAMCLSCTWVKIRLFRIKHQITTYLSQKMHFLKILSKHLGFLLSFYRIASGNFSCTNTETLQMILKISK